MSEWDNNGWTPPPTPPPARDDNPYASPASVAWTPPPGTTVVPTGAVRSGWSAGIVAAVVGAVVGALALTAAGVWAVTSTHVSHPVARVSWRPPSRGSQLTTADRSPDGTAIDPTTADSLVRRYWRLHERALAAHDLVGLAALTGGAQRRWEQPSVECGCEYVATPRPLAAMSTFVTRQTRYPASFIAEVKARDADGGYQLQLLVFTKERARRPWLVTESSGFTAFPGDPVTVAQPAADASGYDQPVEALRQRSAARLARDYAQLWQGAKDDGAVPSQHEFALNNIESGRVSYLAQYPQDTVQANGLRGHVVFSTSSRDALAEGTTSDGSTLVCQPVRERVDYSPVGGGPFDYTSADRRFPLLAPGRYREVVSRDAWQTCFVLPADPLAPADVFDWDTGGPVPTGVR